MDDLARQEIDGILSDPDYEQHKLTDWFRSRYGSVWAEAWRRYMETGEIMRWID